MDSTINPEPIDQDTNPGKPPIPAYLERMNMIMGQTNLSLEQKIRQAIRAAKYEEMPLAAWHKASSTIPEGASTTQANEMFCWARSMIFDLERASCLNEAEARKKTALRLLANDGN
jgi:hypothetical protein